MVTKIGYENVKTTENSAAATTAGKSGGKERGERKRV